MKGKTTAHLAALVGFVLLLLGGGDAAGQQLTTRQANCGRFVGIDLYLDPLGQTLAAYQLEVTDPTGTAKLVGIEGGDHPAFREPPFYDPAALGGGRVIIAALSTDPRLPRSKTRVATLHLHLAGEIEPDLQVRLEVANTVTGEEIPVTIDLEGVGP